ncbi:MAG: outer membrane protein assembly factor BamA [Bdellovibrionaceae bacterium]|nr:outer membrane protein assembly factor BamA [Pseudobdellovibrionaceae bacterium]
MTQYIIIFFTLFYTSISYSATVYKVSIKGNRLVETSIIKSHIQLNKGSVYSSKKVQKDVKKLFSLGFFDDIKVYSSYDKKNRLHLLYDFKERIFISEIQFKGNKSITLEELKKLSFINEYSFLNYDNLKKSLSVITEKYKEKAYYLAELSYIFKKDTNKPSHTLIIEIKERSKLLVQKINFIGNRNISSHTLKSFLLTKEKNILSFLGSSGVYQSKNIDRDLQAIQYYYRDKGYLNVQVQDPEISISSDKRFLSVTFSISEGLRFKMGKQFFEGDDVVSASELKNRFKLEKKDYFSLSALQEDMQMIALLYKNKGYAFVEVQPLFFPDQLEEDKINVSFKVDKGLTYKIRRTHIKGNSDTRDKVIFKRFQIVEGDLFNQSKVDLTRQLLQQLPYLEKVDIQSQIYSPGQLDLLTEITERENTGEASLAGGYNSQTRLFIQAGIKKQNFLGLDQSIALNVTLSKYQENFIFSYKNPYFLDSNWNFGIDLFNTGQDSFTGSGNSSLFSAFSNDYLTYFRKDTGFSFSVGRHLTNFSTLFLKYKFNDLKLSNKRIYYLRDLPVFSTVFDFLFGSGEEDKDPALETEETVFKTPFENNLVQKSDLVNMRFSDIYDLEGNSGLNSSISAIWEYDKRNDRYYPSSGFFTRFSIEYSGLGGLFEWTKIQGELRHYYKPLWKLVVKNRLNTGAVFSNDKNKKVPFTELFLLGGPYDLRGFSVRSQGPKARSQEAYEYALKFNEISEDKINPDTFALRPYGGEQKFLYSLELEVPIVEKAGLRGAMFFDLGESNDRLSFDLQDQLRANIGFGVRWRSPFGPISLDWALPYKPRKEFQEKTWEFHFSMGSSL